MPALLKGLIFDFAMVWSELFPAEQVRNVQPLLERVDVQEEALEVLIRAEGDRGRRGGCFS
jgi:hypothetical protein